MKLSDLTLDSLGIVGGIEKRLRERRRNAFAALAVAGTAIVVQVVLATFDATYREKLTALGRVAQKLWAHDFTALRGDLGTPAAIGAFIVIGGLLLFLTFRWTAFLLRESEECFRYTFEIDAFEAVQGTPGDRCIVRQADQLTLMSRDLSVRLNNRIRRLSLLNTGSTNQSVADGNSLAAHICIGGWYVIRETRKDRWVVQVMATVRIGGKERPSRQTDPIEYQLREISAGKPGSMQFVLSATDYNQLVERVYSRVATEVYRQIEDDIRQKILLFPTAYRRAVALSAEAEDFMRSNTIDAYDRALELYRDALRYFRVTDIPRMTSFLAKVPLLWRIESRFLRRKAAVVTGYARSLIYRRKLSALTGRIRNPMFEVSGLLQEVIDDLHNLHNHIVGKTLSGPGDYDRAFLNFPKDSWLRSLLIRPGERLFEQQRKVFFDAYVARALAHTTLEAFRNAREDLDSARAIDPVRSERDPLYLLTAGEHEPDVEKAIGHVERAAELDPEFQMARFRLAYYQERRFRNENDLAGEKVNRVIEAYDDVLRLNPGNIAALAAQGYLLWLVKNPAAGDKLRQGLELKNIVEETYVGELNYRLARIAAESGFYLDAHDHYMQAVAADPGIAVYAPGSSTRTTTFEHGYIGSEMLERFDRYADNVLRDITRTRKAGARFKDKSGQICSERTLSTVRSFVQNDRGVACYQYYFRHGLNRYLRKAIKAFQEAVEADPANAPAQYNLAFAKIENGSRPQDVTALIEKAKSLAPTWPAARTGNLHIELNALQNEMDELRSKLKEVEKKLAELPPSTISLEIPLPATADKFGPDSERDEGSPQQRDSSQTPSAGEESLPARRKALLKNLVDAPKGPQKRVISHLQSAISETRFGPMIDGNVVNTDGGGVDADFLGSIEKDRLSENDVDVLRLWAEVLWNSENESARRAARSLSQLHLTFYEDDFESGIQILNALDSVERQNAEDGTANRSNDPEAGRDPQRVEQWLRIHAGRLREAGIATIERWLDEDPIHCGALDWLSDTRLKIETETQEAMFKTRPRDTPGCDGHFGRIASDLLKWDEAEKFFRSAIKADSQEGSFHAGLGRVLAANKRYEEAVKSYRTAIQCDKKNDVDDPTVKETRKTDLKLTYNDWGNALYAQAEYAQAALRYKNALDVDNTDSILYSNHALALENLGPDRAPEAIQSLQEALKIDKKNSVYLQRLERLRKIEVAP